MNKKGNLDNHLSEFSEDFIVKVISKLDSNTEKVF